jgi:hypothetical protein
LDPDTPLPEEVRLLVKRPVRPRLVRTLLFVSPLLIVAGVIFLFILLRSGLPGMTGALCGVPLALGFIALGGFFIWVGRRERRNAEARAAGRLRLGLFLGPDRLLLRLDRARCHLLPRDQIVRVTAVPESNPNWPGTYLRLHIIARRTAEKGVRLQFWARDVAAGNLTPRSVAALVAEWAGVDLGEAPEEKEDNAD